MSVEVALAIVPICLSALNGISLLRAKFKIIRRYDREVAWIRRKLHVQVENFEDELCHVLIDSCEARGAVAEGRTECMVYGDDAENAPEWRESGEKLESYIREHFGERKFKLFRECIGQVEATTRLMLRKLSDFADPNERVTWSRMGRDAFRIAFNKQEYNEQICVLKELNEEMRRSRKMAKVRNKYKRGPPPAYSSTVGDAVPQQAAARTEPGPSSGTLLKQYKASRRLLTEFLAALSYQWSCKNDSHSHHTAQVLLRCVESREGETRLGFLLAWWSQQGHLTYRRILPLEVSKRYQTQPSSGLISPPVSSSGKIFVDQRVMECDAPAAKRRRTVPPENMTEEPPPSPGSSKQDSLCSLLTQPPASFPLTELQFSKTPHITFEAGSENLEAGAAGRVTALSDLLELPVYDVVSDRHRITVALTLVKAMLKFHTTRAWPRGCLMSRVKLYSGADDADRDLAACLSTLHISVDVGPVSGDVDMEHTDSIPPESIEEARDKYGIQNIVLYSLGVALLQIGLWEDVQWNDVALVRRKTARLSYLGEKYHRITKDLVYCVLESGVADLASDRLQEGVIRKVVFGLEELLSLTKHIEPSKWPQDGF